MSNHQLQITAKNKPTVLERLLQVTRYRGFSVSEFYAAAGESERNLSITLKIEDLTPDADLSKAGINRLHDQLNKLIDVHSVNLLVTADGSSVECQM